MADGFVRLPGDSTGKSLDTRSFSTGNAATTETVHREVLVVGDPTGINAVAAVTSSAGLLVRSTGPVTITSGTVTVEPGAGDLILVTGHVFNETFKEANAIGGTVDDIATVAADEGAITPVRVTAQRAFHVNLRDNSGLERGTLSAPITISGTILSASSGLVQISGTPTVTVSTSTLVQTNLVTSSGAYVPTTTGTGLLVQATGPVSISGTVTVLSASSGLIQMLGNVTTSTPEYAAGIQLVTMTTAGQVRVFSTAGGSGSTSVNIVGSSNGAAVVTTSGGLAVTIVAGAGAGSTEVHVVGSSGNILQVTSSAGARVFLTSGLVSITSGIVTSTAATNPWSSAPSFNVPIVSVSSGLVQISGSVATASSGVTQIIPHSSFSAGLVFSYVSSSSANSNNVQSGNTSLLGYAIFNTTVAQRFVKVYTASSAPTVGSTANFLMTLGIPGSTAGGGANLINPIPMAFSTRGLAFTITANPPTTDTGTIGNNDLVVNFFYTA